jgi:DNA-binding PadR family transcriptional regulator
MKHLSRIEELILLTVFRLKEEAYCVPIFDHIQTISPNKLTLGSIYPPLYRLEKNGYLESHLGDPTTQRGGKSKRFYRVTEKGLEELQAIRKLQEASWDGLAPLILK